jgi:hypothetical protein
MRSMRKSHQRWWWAAMASLCLAAGAAEAQNKAQERQRAQQAQAVCEEQCAQATEEKAMKCMERCPLPRGGKTDEFEACSQRCIKEAATDTCTQKCIPETRGTKKGAGK